MFSNLFWRFLGRHWPIQKGRTRIYRAAWSHLRGEEILRDDFGNRLLLDLGGFIDTHIALDGAFERENIELLLKLARERACSTFIDIGANIGVYSLVFAREQNIRKVYAFEPDPKNLDQLAANLELNSLKEKVVLSRIALSSRAGEAEFFISRGQKELDWSKTNRGTSSLTKNPERHTESIKVQTRPLDDLLDIKGESIAIKIDVEGHEPEVIGGMRRILLENDCLIHIEIFPENFDRAEAIFRELGYNAMKGLELGGENHIYRRI